jgi:hypothetical protein
MACNEIHLNDIGVQFLVTLKDCDEIVDISSATTKNFLFLKPSGELLTKAGSLETDGTDGQLYYISASGDLNEVGTWKMQCNIIIGTFNWHSDVISFKVHRNID